MRHYRFASFIDPCQPGRDEMSEVSQNFKIYCLFIGLIFYGDTESHKVVIGNGDYNFLVLKGSVS